MARISSNSFGEDYKSRYDAMMKYDSAVVKNLRAMIGPNGDNSTAAQFLDSAVSRRDDLFGKDVTRGAVTQGDLLSRAINYVPPSRAENITTRGKSIIGRIKEAAITVSDVADAVVGGYRNAVSVNSDDAAVMSGIARTASAYKDIGGTTDGVGTVSNGRFVDANTGKSRALTDSDRKSINEYKSKIGADKIETKKIDPLGLFQADKAGEVKRSDMANFLATDDVPETLFGIPVVSDPKDYTEADVAFFKKHPEAGGYYDMGNGEKPEPPGEYPETEGAMKAGDADELADRINLAVSQAVPFIKEHEGFRDKAYQDSVGKWTIGYGQTEIDGRPVRKGDVIDEPTASKFVERRVRDNAIRLYQDSTWTNRASANALSALYDLAYNMGVHALSEKKSPTLNRTGKAAVGTNAVDEAIWAQVPTYIKAGGKVLKGLKNRREDAIKTWRK